MATSPPGNSGNNPGNSGGNSGNNPGNSPELRGNEQEVKKNTRKLKRLTPEAFPEWLALQAAKQALAEAEVAYKNARKAWSDLGK